MWTLLLLWKLQWIIICMFDLAHFAECGQFFTTALRKVSYIQNVTEQNQLVFALKSDQESVVYLYNDKFKTGAVVLGYGVNRKLLTLAINCKYYYFQHTSDLITPTEYSWLWLRWTGTQIEFGTGKIPGVDLLHSHSFANDVKNIGFAKYGGGVESHWIVGQNDELINESKFRRKENRRIRDTSNVYQVRSSIQCAKLCLSINGCYGFNLSPKVNGVCVCELIQKDMVYWLCHDTNSLSWTVEENSTWTHYYL